MNTTYWPPAELAGLHVNFGEQAPSGRWRRPPTASYVCACGFHAGASGSKQVAEFTATVPAAHLAACHHHNPRQAF